MMKTGTATVGQRIACPDGHGVVEKVLNPDVVVIKLDQIDLLTKRNLLAQFDISECRSLENPKVDPQPQPAGSTAS